ncbi:MAG TPA: hypothetical protein VGD05_06275 [Pyrinomonadaceae bacterium]|jgi:hypothetical protein
MPKIEDLIAKCEESEMFTQNLDENIVAMDIKKGNGYVTFVTDPEIVKNKILEISPKISIVTWLPNDVFDR